MYTPAALHTAAMQQRFWLSDDAELPFEQLGYEVRDNDDANVDETTDEVVVNSENPIRRPVVSDYPIRQRPVGRRDDTEAVVILINDDSEDDTIFNDDDAEDYVIFNNGEPLSYEVSYFSRFVYFLSSRFCHIFHWDVLENGLNCSS